MYRGKYTYVVNWKYIFRFEDITREEYIGLSNGVLNIEDFTDKYILLESYKEQVDQDATDRANTISRWVANNKYPIFDSIDIEDLKRFRTLLAELLLNTHMIDGGYDFSFYTDDQRLQKMLEYYAANMNDCAVIALLNFEDIAATQSLTNSVGCGCGVSNPDYVLSGGRVSVINGINGSAAMSTLSKSAGCGCGSSKTYAGLSTSVCDPVAIYRTNVYNYMVKVFSDINFWTIDDHYDVCGWMKTYIDEIIRLNFPLASSIIDSFADCTCKNTDGDEQKRLMDMLRSLSTALGYIIKDEVLGNRNYITKSFTDWATYLYEKMYWL